MTLPLSIRDLQVRAKGRVLLSVRRAIAMLGLNGVRRAALALRDWPGPLNPAAATELQHLIDRCKRAGRRETTEQPAGYQETMHGHDSFRRA